MKKIIIICCILLLLTTLFLYYKLLDNGQTLGNNYYYLPDYEAIDIGYPGGSTIYKSSEEYLFEDIKIQSGIINVAHDKNFILVCQKVKDRADTSNKKHNYYIIIKRSDLVLGPLNKEGYLMVKNKLEISIDLSK